MGWHVNDLTGATGAPLAVNSATPKGYVFEAQRTQHVIYLGPIDIPGQGSIRGRIHELWWDCNGWHHNDLTAATGAPVPDGLPMGYAFDAQNTQHVVYGGTDGHIHELWWDWNGWHHNDLIAATGAPPGGDPTGYAFDAQNTQHVVYGGYDSHIHELWWDWSGWHHNDLTAPTGAPMYLDTLTAYVFDVDPNFPLGTQHVFYVGYDSHIHELWWDNSGGWHHNDLTAATRRTNLVGCTDCVGIRGTRYAACRPSGDRCPHSRALVGQQRVAS